MKTWNKIAVILCGFIMGLTIDAYIKSPNLGCVVILFMLSAVLLCLYRL